MGITDQEMVLKLRSEMDAALKEINKLNKEVGTLTKQTNKSNTALKKQQTAFDGIGKSASKVSGMLSKITLGLGAMGIAMKGIDFAKLAADAEQSSDAFEKVFTDLGLVAEEEFEKIKEASMGLIPEAAIKQSAVTAASLGVPVSKLARLMEIARAKSREMGTDVQSAFNDLATGIGRGSPMILDNLGLSIKLAEANKKYASSIGKTVEQLNKQDKAMALTNAVIESGSSSVERFKDAGLSANEEFQRLNATFEDLKVEIGNQLLPAMVEMAKQTTAWIDSIDDDAIKSFEGRLNTLADTLGSLLSIAKDLNDVFAPDIVFGDGVGVVDLLTRGIALFDYGLTKLVSRIDNVTGAMDQLTQQQSEVDGLSTAVDRFAGDSVAEFNALQEAISDVMDANSKQIEQWNNRQPEIYADKIKILTSENDKLLKLYEKLVGKRPFKESVDGAEEAGEAVKGLMDEVKKYTESEIKEIEKLNGVRVKDTEKALKSLEKSEQKLASDIVKINQKLVKDLAKIANDRFKMNQDVQTQIADLERGNMSDDAAYYDRQKDAEQALANAKLAIKAGEYEKYKAYIEQYKDLITDSAGREIKVNEQVAVSKEETTRRAIAGLQTYQQLQNQFFDKQKADAQAAHDLTVQQKKIELEAVKAQLIAQKELLAVMKELAEAITGKSIDISTETIDAAIAKVGQLQSDIVILSTTPVRVPIDNTTIDEARQKVVELKTLALNGITLKVDADTKPADFDIKKLITKTDGDEISVEVNPEYEKAEKELDAFRKGEREDELEVSVEADTSGAGKAIEALKKNAEQPSTHKVDADTNAASRAIDALKVPTSSVHTVYVKEVHTRAGGGPIPQNLAVGGTFRGSGRVPGYDASDSDKVNARLTGGEFVIKRSSVDKIGASKLARLNASPKLFSDGVGRAIKSFRMPKQLTGYAEGGLVGQPTSTSVVAASTGLGNLGTLTLKVGGNDLQVLAPKDVAEALQTFISSEGGL